MKAPKYFNDSMYSLANSDMKKELEKLRNKKGITQYLLLDSAFRLLLKENNVKFDKLIY